MTIFSITRLPSPPILVSLTALGQLEGPSDRVRYAWVDGSGLWKWYLYDTTAVNGTTCIEASGGSVGRWKIAHSFAGSAPFKGTVNLVATSNITLSGTQTLDGVSTDGRTVLVVGQSTAAQNGKYDAGTGAWTRSGDLDSVSDWPLGAMYLVTEGQDHADEVWGMTSPTSGSVTPGTTATTWALLSERLNDRARLDTIAVASGVTTVTATGDTTGERDREAIEAALSEYTDVLLGAGATYYLDEPVEIPSGRSLRCISGTARLRPGSLWANGVADERTNSVLQIRGAVSGTVSTTLSATATMGLRSMVLTSVSGDDAVTAGQWLKAEGNNIADLFGGQSDAEVCIEMIRVSDAYAGGTTVALANALCMHHAIGKEVVSYSPHIGRRSEGVASVEGIDFDWTGFTTAVGVELTNCFDVRVDRIYGRGFTRSLVDGSGAKNVTLTEPTLRGDCNALVHMSTCHLVEILRPTTTGQYGRVHTLGIPRPIITLDDMCVGVSVRDARIRTVAGFFRTWGGIMCGVDGFDCHDIDCAEIVARDTFMLASNVNGLMGSVWDGGPAELSYATFFFFNYLRNGQAYGLTQPNISNQWAINAHDGFLANVSNVTIGNKGQSSQTAGSYLNGMFISDTEGVMNNVSLHGCRTAVQTKNFIDRWFIDGLYINGAPGEGGQGSIGLLFNHLGGINTSPIFGTVRITNVGNYFYFDAEWLSVPDRSLSIQHAHFDGFIGEKVYALNYAAGPVGGSVLRVTGGSPEAVLETTGPSARNVIAMGPAVNGWGMAAFGDAVAKHSGTAAVRGDLLEADTTGVLVVNNTPASAFTARYRAVVASASGFVNVQKVA